MIWHPFTNRVMSKIMALIGRGKCLLVPAKATMILSLDSGNFPPELKCKNLLSKMSYLRPATALFLLKYRSRYMKCQNYGRKVVLIMRARLFPNPFGWCCCAWTSYFQAWSSYFQFSAFWCPSALFAASSAPCTEVCHAPCLYVATNISVRDDRATAITESIKFGLSAQCSP